MVGSLVGGALLQANASQTTFYSLMSILALAASLAFWFTRTPLQIEHEQSEKILFQASHLSNVNDYFNTTRSEIQSNGESFQANFARNTESMLDKAQRR